RWRPAGVQGRGRREGARAAEGRQPRRARREHPQRGVPVPPLPGVHAARHRGLPRRPAAREEGASSGMRRRPSGETDVTRRAGADAPAARRGRREGGAVTAMRRCWWLVFLLLGAWDPVTRKQADVAKGNEQMKAGKPVEAEKLYQKALGELPSNPGVLYDLGAAHYAAAQAMPPGPDRQKLLETAAQE